MKQYIIVYKGDLTSVFGSFVSISGGLTNDFNKVLVCPADNVLQSACDNWNGNALTKYREDEYKVVPVKIVYHDDGTVYEFTMNPDEKIDVELDWMRH